MNSEAAPCRQCGTPIPASARFCESCGAEQATQSAPTVVAEPAIDPPAAPAIGSSQVTEFVQLLRDYSQLPGVRLATLAAAAGAVITLAVGFLLAIAIPDESFAHLGSEESSDLWPETLFHAARTTLATLELNFDGGSITLRSAPLLFAAVPVAGCALGSYVLSDQTRTMPSRLRYAWAAAVGVPFGLLMLVISLLGGSISDGGGTFSPSEGSVLVLGVLWGALGGILGTVWVGRSEDDAPGAAVSPWAQALDVGRETLRPLVLSLLILTVVATALWVTQSVRDAADAREDRSLATALVDDLFFSADFGFRFQGLGEGAEFSLFNDDLLGAVLTSSDLGEEDSEGEAARFLPIPVSGSKVSGGLIEERGFDALDARFRIFDYGNALPAGVFAPLLLVLMVIPAFFALYAGFAVARTRAAARPLEGALWGALVGPAWAVVLALVNALTGDLNFGQVDGDNLFVITLFVGAALGAIGGLGATQQQSDSLADRRFD